MTKKGKTRKTHKKSLNARTALLGAVKWLFVAGVWLFMAAALLTAWYATELPAIIDSPHFERRSAITVNDRTGATIARFGELKGVSVTTEDLPAHLIYAVMAVEDRRFYEHWGIDPLGILRAAGRNLTTGRVAQGGSTITQQLAKNLFLSHERTLKRKIQEALLALWLEHEFSKDEILTAYLNRVYLGAGAYGVDAAARTYFDKPATKVTLYESAVLAGLLKAPSRYSPQNNPTLAAQRARVVLGAMADAGYITAEQATAQSMQGQASLTKPAVGQADRYYADWVANDLDDMVGATEDNLTVATTLHSQIQRAAEKIFGEALRRSEDRGVTQGALIVMSRDGAILAMIGGADYSKSEFNRATQARRPPGSSFKPLVFLAALETSWRHDQMIDGAPLTAGRYRPANFHGESFGLMRLDDALALSVNTAAVRLMRDVGVGEVIALARRMGIKSELEPDLSLALGSSGVPMIEMVAAYGAIANGGMTVTPYAVTKITDDTGRALYSRGDARRSTRAFSRRAAADLRDMMRDVIEHGTGKAAKTPFDAAGKTGTSQDFRDAWFIGFSDRFVAAVWFGNDDNSPMQNVTGGSLPAGVWRDVMIAAHETEIYGGGDAFEPVAEKESGGFFTMLRGLFND